MGPETARKARELAASPPTPGDGPHAGFAGPVDPARDPAWLLRLASADIVDLKLNGGGASVTLKVRFADGASAVLKPEQTMGSSHHRAEVAAYHLDRLLGLGRVAPVATRRLPLAFIRAMLEGDEATLARVDAEVIARDGVVEGALIAWHERPLFSDDPTSGLRRWLTPGAELTGQAARRAPELADLLLFDALIDNTDRFSGGNVLTLGRDGPIVFLDNASAFLPFRAKRNLMPRDVLGSSCRFVASTVAALRARRKTLPSQLRASLARDPGAPVLSDELVTAFAARIDHVLGHVDQCIAKHGEAPVLSLGAGRSASVVGDDR